MRFLNCVYKAYTKSGRSVPRKFFYSTMIAASAFAVAVALSVTRIVVTPGGPPAVKVAALVPSGTMLPSAGGKIAKRYGGTPPAAVNFTFSPMRTLPICDDKTRRCCEAGPLPLPSGPVHLSPTPKGHIDPPQPMTNPVQRVVVIIDDCRVMLRVRRGFPLQCDHAKGVRPFLIFHCRGGGDGFFAVGGRGVCRGVRFFVVRRYRGDDIRWSALARLDIFRRYAAIDLG